MEFSTAVLKWYDKNRRVLPWRYAQGERPDAYRVWLSEIMLQQTTVITVKDYFERFTTRFPNVDDLAMAKEDEVMAMWSGLGYYSRARNLYACAKVVVKDYGGAFPSEEKELKKLPGIGDYTAAAIRTIAFNKPAVVVDGNIERIMARVFEIATPLPKAKKEIAVRAGDMMPSSRYGDYVQGLMDIGAGVCLPRNPRCDVCPVRSFCGAQAKGTMEVYPVKAPKRKVPVRRAAAFVLLKKIEYPSRARPRPALSRGGSDCSNQNQDKKQYEILMRKRPDKGMLAGMMEVPTSPWSASHDVHPDMWMDYAPLQGIEWLECSEKVRHVFSHVKLQLNVYVAVCDEAQTSAIKKGWVAPHALNHIALPTVFRKVLELAGVVEKP